MSNTYCNPLPDGLIDELLDQLPKPTLYHLITHLCDLKTVSSRTAHSTDLRCHRAEILQAIDASETPQSPENNSQLQELQAFILPNITRIGNKFLSRNEHNLHHILFLCRLIAQGFFCNLIELDLRFDSTAFTTFKSDADDEWDAKQTVLTALHSLAPSILSSLPRLKVLTLSKIHIDQSNKSLPFSIPRLFPPGHQSLHLEKLHLSSARSSKAQFKYLALHSNYSFPSLNDLVFAGVPFYSTDAADLDGNSAMHYMLQWVEKSMPKLACLAMYSCDLTTRDLSVDLANSPILSRLESLDLSFNPKVNTEGWRALFSSTQFTNSQGQDCGGDPTGLGTHHNAKMRTLKLSYNSELNPLTPLLAQNCPYLTNLTTLSLDRCRLNDSSIQSICESKWIRGLETLSVENNNAMTSNAVRMIADCEGMQNLTTLQFGRHPRQFCLDMLRHMTQSQHVSRLTKIELDLTNIPYDHSVEQTLLDFFHSPKASALTHLNLSYKTIPQSTIKLILLSPTLSNLEFVMFGMGQTGSGDDNEWVDAFVASPNCRKLQSLILRECNLTDSNLLAISQSPYLSNLSVLELSNNPALTDDAVKHLAESDVLQLKKLEFRSSPLLTPFIFEHLGQSPRLLSCLENLGFYFCPLVGDENRNVFDKAGWFDGEFFCRQHNVEEMF